MLELTILMPRFKSTNFCQNTPKIKLLLQKNEKFSCAGGFAYGGFLATRMEQNTSFSKARTIVSCLYAKLTKSSKKSWSKSN